MKNMSYDPERIEEVEQPVRLTLKTFKRYIKLNKLPKR